MFAQVPLPPALEKLAVTPVLASEMPAGFARAKIIRLPVVARFHTLGTVRIDFSYAHGTDSASYTLTRTAADARRLVKTEEAFNTRHLVFVRAVTVGKFAIVAGGATAAKASAMLQTALAHFRRVEG
jgi:hypothetical protein